MRCANRTCERPLTRIEVRDKHTRCATCRGDLRKLSDFHGSVVPPKPPPRPISWWACAPRDHFFELATLKLVTQQTRRGGY